MNAILVAGGSGLIGSKLIKILKQKNYEIVLLSTQKNIEKGIETHFWDPENGVFPNLDLKRFRACINFCGAGIFDRRISSSRKTVLLNSRIIPIRFLISRFAAASVRLPQFISASAMGYYPDNCLIELDENSTAGNGYIAELVQQWEAEAHGCLAIAEHVCVLRISNVLAREGGFLKKLSTPVLYYAGAVPGSGKQMQSWIHIDDLCRMLVFVLENQLDGTYNAASPEHNSMHDMTRRIALKLRRRILLPNIPGFALRLVFGKERSILLQSSFSISPKKIRDAGFHFEYDTLNKALDNLLT